MYSHGWAVGHARDGCGGSYLFHNGSELKTRIHRVEFFFRARIPG